MQQPEGFENGKKVCKLLKSIYGLKQASHQWNKTFTQFLEKHNLMRLKKDSCIFKDAASRIIIALYVDDGLILSRDSTKLREVINFMQTAFKIRVANLKTFIGLQVTKLTDGSIIVHQEDYTKKVLKKFELSECKGSSTPFDVSQKLGKDGAPDGRESQEVDVPYREALGCLNYLSQQTRPDIAFAVSFLSRFSESPRLAHWNAVKRIMRYLKETSGYGLMFRRSFANNLIVAYCDADFAGDIDKRHSTSGYVILMNGGAVAWKSAKQKTVATSTTEAELVAASSACKAVLWARQLLAELGIEQHDATTMFVDNQSAIAIAGNRQSKEKTKHMQVKDMFIQEVIEQKHVKVKYVESENQLADGLTKPLAGPDLQRISMELGMTTLRE